MLVNLCYFFPPFNMYIYYLYLFQLMQLSDLQFILRKMYHVVVDNFPPFNHLNLIIRNRFDSK